MLFSNWKKFQNFVGGDRGVENIFVTAIQRFLNCNQKNSYKSFSFGKCTSNQRIEPRWSFLTYIPKLADEMC